MASAWAPETIRWQQTGPDGNRLCELGRFEMGGEVNAVAQFLPAGTWHPPYRVDRPIWIFVAEGAFCIGRGEVVATRSLGEYPAGSMIEIPADIPHFDGCHEGTLIFTLAAEGTRLSFLQKRSRYFPNKD